MKIASMVLMTGLFLFSCTGSDTLEQNVGELKDSLQAEIMRVHDDVMPKHLELQKLKKEVDARAEELKNDTLLADNLSQVSVLLDSAYRSMNTWMYEYEPMSKDMTREEIMDYYRVEREKIDAVRDLMLESLDRAIEILQE